METGPSYQENAQQEVPVRFNIYILIVPLVFLAGLALGYLLWGRGAAGPGETQTAQTTGAGAPAAQPAADQPQEVKRYPVPIDDDPVLGNPDAPITIIEFSDYECPYCKRWYQEVYAKLLETYPDQVKFVYRDFPLTSIHPNAQPAAEAANCANEQGAYWQFHDKLFGGELGLSPESYIEYASQLGLDVDQFSQCVAARRYQQEVEADFQYAANLGINSTPTFFINGIPVVGAQPFDVFQYVIDKELAGELPD